MYYWRNDLGTSFRIARIKGIDIRVHITFALLVVWAALEWGLLRGLGLVGALYGVVFIGLLFVCVTLHELAHSLVAQRYGATVRGITLLPIGGVAYLEGKPERPAQEFWMALAGPAVNIVLAVLIGAVTLPLLGWRALGGLSALWNTLNGLGPERLLVDLLTANVGLAVFNLLPAFPMDGGRVLRSLLASRMDELDATRIAVRVGQGLAVLLGLVGLYINAWNLILIAAFTFFGAQQEWRESQLVAALRRVPASAALIRGGVVLAPYDSLARAIDVALRGNQTDFAVFDRGYLVGVLTREDVSEGFRKHGPDVAVGQVMSTDFPVANARGTLLDLQRKLKASGRSAISVVEGGRFVGLATLESVRNALRLFGTQQRWRPVGP
jgi:Zn-dependent protease/predicted transcriptional regulator